MSENKEITISGTLHQVADTQSFPSGFCKREFVINTGGEYPQMVKVEVVKDKCQLLDNTSSGQQITASINIRGNEHNGNYYVNLVAWKLDISKADSTAQPRSAPMPEPSQHDLEGHDDIPF